jgi:hypothetical protein
MTNYRGQPDVSLRTAAEEKKQNVGVIEYTHRCCVLSYLEYKCKASELKIQGFKKVCRAVLEEVSGSYGNITRVSSNMKISLQSPKIHSKY